MRVLITGCSGAGKSTLLAALKDRGFATIEEPGRRIIAGGGPLPWKDPLGFAEAALEMAIRDFDRASAADGPVFFDRGIIDAAAAISRASGRGFDEEMLGGRCYETRVFVAPPWEEIFTSDAQRRHGFDAALEEFFDIRAQLDQLGYEAIELPKTSVSKRVEFVLDQLEI